MADAFFCSKSGGRCAMYALSGAVLAAVTSMETRIGGRNISMNCAGCCNHFAEIFILWMNNTKFTNNILIPFTKYVIYDMITTAGSGSCHLQI